MHIKAPDPWPENGCQPRAAGAGLTAAGLRGGRGPREGPGTQVAGAARCKVIQHRPGPRSGRRRRRGQPPASPPRTPPSGMNAEGRGDPSPHRSPKGDQHCHNNKNLGNSSLDEGDCPPTRTPQQQSSFPKLVRNAASQAAALPPAARALPCLPVRKKASTSESAAPPSSAAPSRGFMTGGGRPRAAGGRRSLGPRAAPRRVGGGRGAQRLRPRTRRTPGFEGWRLGRRG